MATDSFKLSNSTMFKLGVTQSALGLVNSFFESQVANTNAKIAADARRHNAIMKGRIAERNTDIIKNRTEFQLGVKRRQTEALLGQIRSGFGKAGVVLTEGTPAQVFDEVAFREDIDAEAIRMGGFLDMQNELIGASSARTEARLADVDEKMARTANAINFASKITKTSGDILALVEKGKKRSLV